MAQLSIKQQLIKASEKHKEDAKENAEHIQFESFGTDKNKKRKNKESCDRGRSSGPARFCSMHLRQIYPKNIIGDDQQTEHCVCSRHSAACCVTNNPCRLCNIDTQQYINTKMINFGEAINAHLDGNNDNGDAEKYNRRLLSFMISHIGSNYPGTGNEQSILRIKVNGQIWMEYYIKLSAFSSLLKTSAPSGYKYKDRISLGRMIRIQSKQNTDLIFFITKDERYNDPEFEAQRPVVNGVGWWGLLNPPEQGDIRNIIHLNNDQAVNVSFGFLVHKQNNINSIEVELVCIRHLLNMKDEIVPLWSYKEIEEETKSNSSNDLSLSPPISLPSPIVTNNSYNNYSQMMPPQMMPPQMMPPQIQYGPMINKAQLSAHCQITTYEPPLNRPYFPSHGISTSVEQMRYSPMRIPSNIAINNNARFVDEYKMETDTESQNCFPFSNPNMSCNTMMFDNGSIVNGMVSNPNDSMFPDYMSI